MSVRDDLIAALEADDHGAVKRLGWDQAWEAARTWWAPLQKCNAREFLPYANLLGDDDPLRCSKRSAITTAP